MATYGNATTPTTGSFFDNNGNSQFWSSYGSFAGGIVSEIHVFVGGNGSATTGELCIWGLTTLLYHSGSISFPSGAGWRQVTGINTYISPQTLNLGFWSPGFVIWEFESSGSTAFQHSLAGGPATLSPGGNEGSGQLGAYIIYTPGNAHVLRAGSWAAGPATVQRSGAPSTGTAYVMRGGVWVPGA
jgi:hypothetical protein